MFGICKIIKTALNKVIVFPACLMGSKHCQDASQTAHTQFTNNLLCFSLDPDFNPPLPPQISPPWSSVCKFSVSINNIYDTHQIDTASPRPSSPLAPPTLAFARLPSAAIENRSDALFFDNKQTNILLCFKRGNGINYGPRVYEVR